VHISIADLQRNVDLYTSEDYDQFNTFAPGWRNGEGAPRKRCMYECM
jgi:hypothetical protein